MVLGEESPAEDHVTAVSFRIPPEPHFGRDVRKGVAEFASERGVDDDDRDALLTALGEALANAIEHSCCDAPIEIDCRAARDRIVATVRDRGVGFCCASVLALAELPPEDDERGRGLHIMQRCSDIFAIRTIPGGGTVVSVGRYLGVRRVSRGGRSSPRQAAAI
jgi:anti-sigma regulatory factor (Ser/Thr protein kinase)